MREPYNDTDEQRAIVADELALARLGVTSVLHAQGVDVIAETHSGRELASVAAIEQPDLVVVGQPADLSVADTVRRLSKLRPAADGRRAARARSGTPGRLSRRARHPRHRAAIRQRRRPGGGDRVRRSRVSSTWWPALHGALAGSVRPRPLDERSSELLSAREREVLACLAQGRSNREIAATLSVTLATVKSHLVRIYAKLEAGNRNEALGRAVSWACCARATSVRSRAV